MVSAIFNKKIKITGKKFLAIFLFQNYR